MKIGGCLYCWVRAWYLRAFGLFSGGVLTDRVNDFRLRLPAALARHFPHDYEEQNFRFLASRFQRGMTGIDIGAHIGIYSIRMAQLGAKSVHAFEPTPSTLVLLQKMVRLNTLETVVKIHDCAVGAESGTASFFVNEPADAFRKLSVSEANSLQLIDHGSGIRKHPHTVQVTTVDEFVFREDCCPGFIKIDVEGSEVDVLLGSRETLRRFRPAGIVSIHAFTYRDREKTLRRIWELLDGLNYRIHHDGRLLDLAGLLQLSPQDIFDLQLEPDDGRDSLKSQ